jgi:ABC-type Na+ efflux pump permease subunit
MIMNPILQAELKHQWYVLEKSRSGRGWIIIAVIMLLPGLLTSLGTFVAALLNLPFAPPPATIFRTLPEILLMIGEMSMITMNFALYFVVMLISFGLASNSILREKQGRTWESLLLTNISASKLVYGKFMASLYALRGDHLMIGLLRLGLVAWWVVNTYNRTVNQDVIVQVHITLLAAFFLIFTLLDMLLTVALSLFTMLLNLTSAIGLAIFFALRLGTFIYALWMIYTIFKAFYEVPGWQYLITGIVMLIVYGLMTVATLWAAQWAAVSGSLASPGEAKA